jgi:hypothetical protein
MFSTTSRSIFSSDKYNAKTASHQATNNRSMSNSGTSRKSPSGANAPQVMRRFEEVAAVVAQENDERVVGDTELVKMIEYVTQRFIDPLDQRGEGLDRRGPTPLFVMGGKTGIRIEWGVDGIV